MGKAAVVGKGINRALKAPQGVKIGRFRRQRHSGCGQTSLTVETCPRQASTGKEVCDGLQDTFLP